MSEPAWPPSPESRTTKLAIPRPRAASAEPHGSAQRSRDVAHASRPPTLRAPVRLGGVWPAPSRVSITIAWMEERAWLALVALGVVGIGVCAHRCVQIVTPTSAAPASSAVALSPIDSSGAPAGRVSSAPAPGASADALPAAMRREPPLSPPGSAPTARAKRKDVVNPWEK